MWIAIGSSSLAILFPLLGCEQQINHEWMAMTQCDL